MRMRVVVVGALYGAAAVGLGAFGAHVLEGRVPDLDAAQFNTAVTYHGFHAATLVAMGALRDHMLPALLGAASWALALGVLLFCGALYVGAVGGPPQVATLAPVGGLLLIAGWLLLAVGAARRI